jgi:predicted RNA-binding protein YlqC (UPF0109 family)
MVTDFVCTYAKMIVNNPEDIEVSSTKLDDAFYEITIMAHNDDIGKLIGKNGNMINAIKTILNGCKAKDGNSYKIQVVSK